MSFTPILCLDFDGVCHSYISGWKGVDVIPDPPVDGLWEFLDEASNHFEIHIFSSRTHQDGGMEAMWDWFKSHVPENMYHVVAGLRFPREKPSAMVTLDDRGILFTGVWPSIETLKAFKPWNKK